MHSADIDARAGRNTIDPLELRRCLGRFATGVTIVTCDGDHGPHGVTVNSFTSVSLDPPLVLVSLARTSRSCRLLHEAPFAVNILHASQEPLARHFAGRPDAGARVEWEAGDLVPLLGDALASIECSPWRVYDGGDHVLFLGRVERFVVRDGDPLLFCGGRFLAAELAGAATR